MAKEKQTNQNEGSGMVQSVQSQFLISTQLMSGVELSNFKILCLNTPFRVTDPISTYLQNKTSVYDLCSLNDFQE